ncbi:MAG: hypothetical protein HYV93_03650 [Candidatus Rokubacteria bacterium]|nr:hypothetical protein [Candidatus Rokubacteria bacterium]
MGYFFGRLPIAFDPVVTRQEYLDAADRALDALAHEADRRDAAYRHALEYLAAGRPARATRAFSSLLEQRPRDPTLHRMLGISHFHAGNARLAVRHLETALILLTRAEAAGIPLVRTLRIEVEACVVRLALVAAYARLGHRAGVIRCLSQNRPLTWPIRSRRGP